MSGVLFLALLAVIQGVTEFLPVSSSGHLALAQLIADVGDGSLIEDVVLHLGTLVAVGIYYRRELGELIGGVFTDARARRYALLLVLANVPAGLVGVLAKDRIEALFASPWAVLGAMAATGFMLWSTRGIARPAANSSDEADRLEAPPLRAALIMGCAQALAILPGASRSGWTVAVGLHLGLRPAAAARFSFLMSMPAIFGAALLTAKDVEGAEVAVPALLVGFVLSALVGYFCLSWLVRLVRNMTLHRFSPYLWAVAAVGAGILLAR